MKTNLSRCTHWRRIAATWLTLAAVTAFAEVEDKISKSFAVSPGGQLVVAVDRGAIEIKTADRDSVEIEVNRKAGGNRAKAGQTLKDHVVTTAQNGNQVAVHAKYEGEKPSGWFGRPPELQANYVITIPRKFDVDLKTAGGSVKVDSLSGRVQAQSSGGSLKFAKIEGSLTGRTAGGSISIAGCKGPVEVATSGGSLDLGEIEGDVSAKTAGGSIHAHQLAGKSVVQTSGGGIDVAGIKGSIEAGTAGGSISAELLAPPSGDCSFKTSGGSITVTLGEAFGVDVDLRTSAGRVASDFPVVTADAGQPPKNKLCGKINGGGPLITAHTSGGSVRLQKK